MPAPGAGTVSSVAPLNRTLDQELSALLRAASYECLVCGEFVLHRVDGIGCPECGAEYGEALDGALRRRRADQFDPALQELARLSALRAHAPVRVGQVEEAPIR